MHSSIARIQGYILADLLCVLVETLPQLGGVGADAAVDVAGVLLHHGLELAQVLDAAILGFQHVPLKPVAQQLQILGHLTGRGVGEGPDLGLDVIFVFCQLGDCVCDQSAGGGRGKDNR